MSRFWFSRHKSAHIESLRLPRRERSRVERATSFLPILCLFFVISAAIPPAGTAHGETEHRVYLKGTDSELDVYFIKGREPGPTLLLVGGIQGNEPGGYLAADLYADISLKKGALIVVPRANFVSIVKNRRGVRGDMNRKFAGSPRGPDNDAKVVEVLKTLMERSDFFLNLHDGSGFYAPKWESPLRNPMRYGQSLIADAEEYRFNDGNVLHLGEMARRVIQRVNPRIVDSQHLFQFNNHQTLDKNSRHSEQRLSATFHALTKVGIPAFGIETSKNIRDYRLRVRYQTMVINAFLEEFGIELENPNTYLENPKLKYLIVSINGRTPIVINGKDVLTAQKGDRIRIVHIEANYSRGLTARIHGESNDRLNHVNHDVLVTGDTHIDIRKDRFLIATIPIEIDGRRPRAVSGSGDVHLEPRVRFFCVKINDKNFLVEPDEEITAVRGDMVVIQDAVTNLHPDDERAMRIDLRGFQAVSSPYPHEDRGHIIHTEKDLQEKYAKKRGARRVFALQAKLNNSVFAQSYLAVLDPRLHYVILETHDTGSFVAYAGDTVQAPSDQVVRIKDLRTNMAPHTPLFITMAGKTVRWQKSGATGIDISKLPDGKVSCDVTRKGSSIGRIWIEKGKGFRISSGGRRRTPLVPVTYSEDGD